MIINFRQGIISYDTSISPFTAAASPGGVDVTLNVGTEPFVLTVANQTANYLWSESLTVDAWPSLSPTGTYWLYLDFNSKTFARTFGATTLQPIVQGNAPVTPANGQHWYKSTTSQMYVWNGATWNPVIRVFVCKFAGPSTFSSLSINSPSYLGTTVGDTTPGVSAGRVLVDSSGYPIFKHDGTFFTTEDQSFAEGSAVNGVRLESNVFTAQSAQPTIIPVYEAVAFNPEGQVRIASYNDSGTTAIGLALQQINFGQTGAVLLEGTVTNPMWNFAGHVGGLLWVSGAIPGNLQPTDPHIDDPVSYPIQRVPVARIISPTSIIFLQGIGTKGDPGPSGSSSIALATSATPGVVYLSTDAGALPSPTPVVVSELDPRLTNARAPLAHNQGAATIIVTPNGNITTTNAQAALQELDAKKLSLTGGTLTGPLYLYANPTLPLEAATKQYVDTAVLGIGANYVLKAGDTMSGLLILSGDPTTNLGAATKHYVDAAISGFTGTYLPVAGGTMSGGINMSTNTISNLAAPVNPSDAATKSYVDTITSLPNLVLPYDIAFFVGGNMLYTNTISGAYLASRTITIPVSPASGSVAKCNTAPLATVTYNIDKNGVQVGTVVFTSGSTVGTVTIGSPVSLVSGDTVTLVSPNTLESTIKDIFVTIIGSAIA